MVEEVEALVVEPVEVVVVGVVEVASSTTPVDDLLVLHSNGQHRVSQPMSKIGNVASRRSLRKLVDSMLKCILFREVYPRQS